MFYKFDFGVSSMYIPFFVFNKCGKEISPPHIKIKL